MIRLNVNGKSLNLDVEGATAALSTGATGTLAAELTGVPTRRITFSVYVIVGFFTGLAAFLLSARLSSAEAVAGLGLELTVIASVVIGGTSLFGGVGRVVYCPPVISAMRS